MVEPERDDKAEQAARNEENKQEAARVLKLQRQELLTQLIAPSNVLGLLSLYLVFLGTVVAFGVLAFYTGHKITQEIVFFSCIILFLVLPIGFIWYLRPIFTKKDALGKRLLDKIKQSKFSKSVARLGNDRSFRLSNLAGCASMIVFAIRTFSAHPRFSLTVVIIYLTLAFASVIFWVSEVLERNRLEHTSRLVDALERVWAMANYARGIAEASHKYLDGTEKSHSEAHETTAVAIRAINDALQLVAATKMHAQDAPSREQKSGKAKGDEEPTDS